MGERGGGSFERSVVESSGVNVGEEENVFDAHCFIFLNDLYRTSSMIQAAHWMHSDLSVVILVHFIPSHLFFFLS